MSFHPVLIIIADSSHLRRVEKASLSTQALMEIFIDGIENRELICGNREEPADIDKWKGITYSRDQPIDATEKQLRLKWFNLNLVGTIDF